MKMPREIRSALIGPLVVLGAFLPLSMSSGALPDPGDPNTISRVEIVVDNVAVAAFGELVTIRSGNDDILELGAARLLLPKSRLLPIAVLRRGHTGDLTMSQWHEAALKNLPGTRKSATLVMYDVEGAVVARYHLENAWPSKLEIGALKAGASQVLLETVTMTCEFIQRVAV